MTSTIDDLVVDSEAASRWQDDQTRRAVDYLEALPTYDGFARRLREIRSTPLPQPLQRAGSRWFRIIRAAGSASVTVRDQPAGPERVLVQIDTEVPGRDEILSVDWFTPSHDGRYVAVGCSVAGREDTRIRVIEVSTGTGLSEDIPWIVSVVHPVTWLPDSSGLLCMSRERVGGKLTGSSHVYLHRLGHPPATAPERVPSDLDEATLSASPASPYIACHYRGLATEFVRHPDGSWHEFLRDVPGSHVGQFVDDRFIAVVDDGHPRGRVVSIPIDSPTDPTTWTELVPEGREVLQYLRVVAGKIVVGFLRDAAAGVAVFDLDGTARTELPLPAHAGIGTFTLTSCRRGLPMFADGSDEISFLLSTPTTSTTAYRYDVRNDELGVLAGPRWTVGNATTRLLWARSSDGRYVPATVTAPVDDGAPRPRPALIGGYGNFGTASPPGFRAGTATFVEAGGISVVAHLRGGGDLGADWFTAPDGHDKQLTFDDLYAIADELIRQGITSPGQLAFEGASGGGLTAGVAVVQRPQLFAAVVARVPLLDLLGNAAGSFVDRIVRNNYGDLDDPADFARVATFSPLHCVQAGTAYPATLVICGENDARCPLGPARGFAALLQARTTGSAPILLRVHIGRGHVALGVEGQVQEEAEYLSFVAEQTGLRDTRT